MEKHSVILDVRSRKEYCKGHICNSTNIPTPLPPVNQKVLENKLRKFIVKNKVPKNIQITVYCKKGVRSKEAVKILRKLGMSNVIDLGGIEKNPLRKTILQNKIICYCNNQ